MRLKSPIVLNIQVLGIRRFFQILSLVLRNLLVLMLTLLKQRTNRVLPYSKISHRVLWHLPLQVCLHQKLLSLSLRKEMKQRLSWNWIV
nr:MAG TPA: hypothetical protein [Caudoviricetes sp.]